MARIALGEWKPDIGDLDANILTTCQGVLAGANGYYPHPGFNLYGNGTALIGAPLGWYLARDVAGNYQLFVAANDGVNDRIYHYNQTLGTWDDVSKAGGYLTCDATSGWRFAQFGSYVYAVSGINNPMQKLDTANISAGFANVGGLGSPPRARYIGVVNHFLVAASLDTSPYSVQWSEIGNGDNWRALTNGSDTQVFEDGSWITGFAGGEYGLIFQERNVRRMIFSPGAVGVFDFVRIQENRGCPSPNSICQAGDRTFWLGEDGFWMEYQGNPTPIGKERVDRTWQNIVAGHGYARILGYADPVSQRVYWGFPTRGTTNLTERILDTIWIYDFVLDRWTQVDGSINGVSYLIPVATVKYDLDSPPIADYAPYPANNPGGLDAIMPSFDDPYWDGGRPKIGGFNSSNQLGTFNGNNMEATFVTCPMQINEPNRAFVTRVQPLVDTSTVYSSVAGRGSISGADSYTTERLPSARSGYVCLEKEGLYHRFKMRIPQATAWTKTQGFDVSYATAGEY